MDTLKEVRHHLGLDRIFSILLGKKDYLVIKSPNFKILDDENTEKREWCENQFRKRLKRLECKKVELFFNLYCIGGGEIKILKLETMKI